MRDGHGFGRALFFDCAAELMSFGNRAGETEVWPKLQYR
jgi:hypothetical protein